MHPTAGIRLSHTPSPVRAALLSGVMMAAMMLCAPAALAQQVAANGVEEVTVTGYAASLEKATDAKRNATNFTDTVFAEDIGKFPDTNIAESLNRIPGVTISREVDGEGVNVSIRGLGTNFTKVTLNGANVAIASTGAADQSNANREVDLNMFPTELFSQLSVSKSPTADMLEGGAAGNVNLRSARPFDREGFRITYNAQGSDYSGASTMGERGSLIVSDTWGDFGALIGVAGVQNKIFTNGWEDGNAGWGTPTLSTAQCGNVGATATAAVCEQLGAAFWTLPTTVPANVTTGGLVPGSAITQATLQQLNPGLTSTQISNLLLPRLGRSMYESGNRDRYNAVASLEWRPSEDLHFYMDLIGGRTFNSYDRSDIDWGVRAGAGSQPLIPENVVLDPGSQSQIGQVTATAPVGAGGTGIGGVVQSGTFANSQFFLEARPYKEKADFFSINPGGSWRINDLMKLDFQVNATRSHFFRDSPTFLLTTCPSAGNGAGVPGCAAPAGGAYVNFSNPAGAAFPSITSNLNLNDPNNYQWNNGAARLQDEKRYTATSGARADFSWGGERIALRVGASYDDAFRAITAIDASQQFQNQVCGDAPSQFLAAGNSQPACRGESVVANSGNTAANITAVNAAAAGNVPAYPGYGTGYTAGFPALSFAGSTLPQSALAGYLRPGPAGFVSVNYPAILAASNYYAIDQAAINAVPNAHSGVTEGYPFSSSSAIGGNSGTIEEKSYAWYGEVVGDELIDGHALRYNLGLRFI
ncbi:MAG: TonB-dependent receptor, partial [Alphaproteobacteria bacterium]|nr:TonB-dependent receptor [Alphaproteobacteria bacterium]